MLKGVGIPSTEKCSTAFSLSSLTVWSLGGFARVHDAAFRGSLEILGCSPLIDKPPSLKAGGGHYIYDVS